MNYDEALEYIHGTLKFGWKLGLHNISRLLELMDNPQKKLKFVHVAGTNGKGSVTAFISNILIEGGYRVGTFISPYIERFTERIKINNQEITRDELARITGYVKSKVDIMVNDGESHPTEFEIVTAIAMQYYLDNKCDIVVLEVGLGGRYDSTNVIDTPLAAVIMTIGYDHTDRLGTTLAEIAYEKAGIIKQGGDVILYPQVQEAGRVFEQACRERNAALHRVNTAGILISEFSIEGQVFTFEKYNKLYISLPGKHQTKNAATAVKVIELLTGKGFSVSEKQLRSGLEKTKWPGRLEVLSKEPLFLIDGAHNPEAAGVLCETLKDCFPDRKMIFIFGVLRDKDYESMLDIIAPLASMFITVTPDDKRALEAGNLANIVRRYCKNVLAGDTIEEAVRTSLLSASPEDIICAFGSLHYIGLIRKLFR